MSGRRTTKDSVGYIANKFAENPGHFAATVLQMYWDMEKQRDQYKAECERLKERNYQLAKINDRLYLDNYNLEQENEELRNKLEGAETYIDAIKTYYPMYIKLRKQYTTLTDHIRLKAENNPSVSRYIDLVNYIDRLERD